MGQAKTISGVLLSDIMDLKGFYGLDFAGRTDTVRLFNPNEVPDPGAIRFAVCWLPGPDAFEPYPNLEMAMSVGAGVDALLDHPGICEKVKICRVRDTHQADLMAGFAAHEVLHVTRDFAQMQTDQLRRVWNPLPISPLNDTRIVVLGNGTMGVAVTKALVALGFSVNVVCRTAPETPLDKVSYFVGKDGVLRGSENCSIVINALPLTPATENVLNRSLFNVLCKGAWLIQIGRGEHLLEDDFMAALENGRLAGASLDVFRQEPLPKDHPFWCDDRLRITPHIASDTLPSVVADQVLISAQELLRDENLQFAIDRRKGY